MIVRDYFLFDLIFVSNCKFSSTALRLELFNKGRCLALLIESLIVNFVAAM
jgi:hypothetical protein